MPLRHRQHIGQRVALRRPHQIEHRPRAPPRHFLEKPNAAAIDDEGTARDLARSDQVQEERAPLGFREGVEGVG